ncbi:hypothetical protein BsWGS_18015 [Bradybaena similaris]
MTSVNQVFTLLDDDDDTPDVKEATSACPSYPVAGRYAVSTPRSMQTSHGDQQPKRQRLMETDNLAGHGKGNSSSSSTMSGGLALKQRDVSEYNYAQALLKQAPKLSGSRDLDRYSVIRLAQAYITLQHGLQSWKNSGNQTKWWPPNIDGGKLALAAQQTMSCFVLIITSKGNVVYVSDAVEVLLGHDQLNLVGRSIDTLVPPEELPVLADQFSSSPGASRGTGAERSFYTRMLNVRRSGLHHQRFELVHAVGHLQEVMLASNTSNSAGQRETWLMCACRVMAPHLEIEGSGSPCTEWVSHNALDGAIIYMDARSCQVSGYLPNEVVGLSPYCFIHQDDQEYVAFSHNQALINVGGSSCTYRMYTHSQDIVYVHSTIQLARDKHTNKPKFLFCLHRLVDEQEWREQVSRHQQELMWVKSDPSVKYSMTDIEKAVKALEVEGGNSPLVMSRGGMKTSVLSDSYAADGGDLLSINLNNHLRVPIPVVPKIEPGLTSSSSLCLQQGTQNFYTSAASQYQQTQNQIPLAASISDSGTGYGGNYGYDNTGRSIQQQQQQQQQPVYSRQLSQQQMYAGVHPRYQQQMSMVGSGSGCQTGLSSGSESPVNANNTGSFVDYLFDTSGPPSVPSDGQLMYSPDMVINQSMISPTGRGRGRSRTRGRPRGSGRGGRGVTRGVRGTRGGRGRGSRGRGRANMITQMSQSHEMLGGMRKSESMISQSSLSPISIHGSMSPRNSLSPVASGGDHLFMSPDSGISLQRSSSSGGNLAHQQMTSSGLAMDIQQISSESEGSNHFQSGNIAGDLQRMRTDDMFQQMSSLDGIDMLDPSSEFSLRQVPNMEMMSPRSWGMPDRAPSAQVSPYKTMSGSEHVPAKRVGRPRGSRNQLERQQHFQRTMSIDDPSVSSLLGFGTGQQSSMYGRESPFHGQSPSSTSFVGDGSRGGGNSGGLLYHGQDQQISNSISGSSVRAQDGFQRSFSFQSQASGRMAADTDPEHSILGNLLKGRAGSASSAGSKSPAQPVLTNMGRSPAQSNGPDRGGKSPLAQPTICDRGGRSPAHSLISDAASPVSVFSPDSSRTTPTVIKDEPELMSSMEESSCAPSVYGSSPGHSKQQHDDILNFVLEQGEHKVTPEVHIFSTQLRQKHHSLEQSLNSQDNVLRQLESSMQQTAKDSNAEALVAKLNFMKANKASQEQELRVIKATFEAQVHHQQQLQHRASQQQQQQQQHLGLQRHRLSSPAPANQRRMAIVPPIQRQTTEGDMHPALSQPSPGDLKGSQSVGVLQHSSPDVGAKHQSACNTGPVDNIAQTNSSLLISGQSQNARQEPPSAADGPFPPGQTPSQLQPPQQSPFSLHHHHHHHHHYHHHTLPQQHIAFPGALKETPPPPYGSYDGSVFSSSAAAASGATAPAALSISVSSTTNSLASPIICDTSPVSVDESPSCASDASSGYHSLTHSSDTLNNLCVGAFSKPHCLDLAPTSSGPTFGSKTPPGYEQSVKGAGKPLDMIQSSTHVGNNSPSA